MKNTVVAKVKETDMDSEDTQKFCCNCKHYRPPKEAYTYSHLVVPRKDSCCRRPTGNISLETGREVLEDVDPTFEREGESGCGEEGKYFEQIEREVFSVHKAKVEQKKWWRIW